MSENNLDSATAYYQAMGNKNISVMEKLLHPEVRLISPLADITGKDAVLNSVKQFLTLFNKLTIRAKFGAGDQAMLAYDLDCPAPFEIIRGAALLTFEEGLIIRYELFYDARPFEKKREEIFSQAQPKK
ncbi:MAG: nuclear transport factor 2 family protein [Chlamydiales bacterium]